MIWGPIEKLYNNAIELAGDAIDYVEAIWKILQHNRPDDFVICTGKQYSIKQFINLTTKKLGMKIKWKGKGMNEKAYNEKGFPFIECDKNYFRPLDVNSLLGDAKKARKKLNWRPKYKLNDLIKDMIHEELKKFK